MKKILLTSFVLLLSFVFYGCGSESDTKNDIDVINDIIEQSKVDISNEFKEELKTFNSNAKEYVTFVYNKLSEKKGTLTEEEYNEIKEKSSNFVNEFNTFSEKFDQNAPSEFPIYSIYDNEQSLLKDLKDFTYSVSDVLNSGATEESLEKLSIDYTKTELAFIKVENSLN